MHLINMISRNILKSVIFSITTAVIIINAHMFNTPHRDSSHLDHFYSYIYHTHHHLNNDDDILREIYIKFKQMFTAQELEHAFYHQQDYRIKMLAMLANDEHQQLVQMQHELCEMQMKMIFMWAKLNKLNPHEFKIFLTRVITQSHKHRHHKHSNHSNRNWPETTSNPTLQSNPTPSATFTIAPISADSQTSAGFSSTIVPSKLFAGSTIVPSQNSANGSTTITLRKTTTAGNTMLPSQASGSTSILNPKFGGFQECKYPGKDGFSSAINNVNSNLLIQLSTAFTIATRFDFHWGIHQSSNAQSATPSISASLFKWEIPSFKSQKSPSMTTKSVIATVFAKDGSLTNICLAWRMRVTNYNPLSSSSNPALCAVGIAVLHSNFDDSFIGVVKMPDDQTVLLTVKKCSSTMSRNSGSGWKMCTGWKITSITRDFDLDRNQDFEIKIDSRTLSFNAGAGGIIVEQNQKSYQLMSLPKLKKQYSDPAKVDSKLSVTIATLCFLNDAKQAPNPTSKVTVELIII